MRFYPCIDVRFDVHTNGSRNGIAFGNPLCFSQRRSVQTLTLNISKTSFLDIKFMIIAP